MGEVSILSKKLRMNIYTWLVNFVLEVLFYCG